MIGFETDLQDLRDSAGALLAAAGAAETASNGLRGQDVPLTSGSGGGGLFGGITAMLPAHNAFGRSLGMPAVAKAYNDHLAKIQTLVAKLHETTADTGNALFSVANLYEQADEDAKTRVHRAAANLEGN